MSETTETIHCIVTYSGDITGKLKACGSQCQHRLNAEGNTEQVVPCFRGRAAAEMPIDEFTRRLEPLIRQDAAGNGTILGCRWVTAESSEPAP